jgi:hypothetical protein
MGTLTMERETRLQWIGADFSSLALAKHSRVELGVISFWTQQAKHHIDKVSRSI